MNFMGKKVVVTGGSSGIGAGIVRELAGRGAQVLAVSRSIKPEDLPYENVITAAFDLRSHDGVDALLDYAIEKLGVIDLLIANAGYGYYGKTEKPDWGQMEDIFSLNVFSPIYTLEKLCALYPKRPFNFAVTASVAGKLPLPGFSLYCSTKFAVDGFMRTFRYEMPDNAFVSVIYPVSTSTAFFKKSGDGVPAPGPVQPLDEAVEGIISGLEKDKREIYPSKVYTALNICSHICPPVVAAFVNSEKNRFDLWLEQHNSKKDGTA
jgi:uncharacterized protein